MDRFSSRFIDLHRYKTKEILLKVLGERKIVVQPSNKKETSYEALCPFHKENTASFKLYYNTVLKGWGYKCFGCGTSGDVFTFLGKYEGWEFWDCMIYLTRGSSPHHCRRGGFRDPRAIQLSIWDGRPYLPDIILSDDPNLPF